MERTPAGRPALAGVGVGLRPVHYGHVLEHRPAVPWFEAVSENYMGGRGGSGGRPREVLERVRADYPVVLHGVSLNIGSTDPLREDYLDRLKRLADEVDPPWVSDHLCWTGVDGQNTHDLLPLPYTEDALEHVAARARRVQDRLGRPFLLENVSSYVAFRHSDMTEWEFLSEVARRADCGILLDVNNIHVSAVNHGFDPLRYVEGVPADRVRQMHLAGPSDAGGGFLIDTHDHPVPEPVWALYAAAARRFGPVPTLIEWDGDIPAFEVLEAQAARARDILEKESALRDAAPAR